MNTGLIDSEAVALVSRITGQKLSQKDITPTLIFLVALVTVLVGVMFADERVEEKEKEMLLKTLYRFSDPNSDLRRLTHLMVKGVRENKVYESFHELQILTAPFSSQEKLLLICFGYEMSAADGEIASNEKGFLQIVSNRLKIDPQYQTFLESHFSQQGNVDLVVLGEVQYLLAPERFKALNEKFVNAAKDLITDFKLNEAKHKKYEEKETELKQDSKLQEIENHKIKLQNICYEFWHILEKSPDNSYNFNDYLKIVEKASKDLGIPKNNNLLKIKEYTNELDLLCKSCLEQFDSSENSLSVNPIFAEERKQSIIEKIGELSGRDVKIQLLADQIVEETIENIINSIEAWDQGLEDRMVEKSKSWSSTHNEKEKIEQDYAEQFVKDLSQDINQWIQELLLEPYTVLSNEVHQELEAIQHNLKSLDFQTGSNLRKEIESLAAVGVKMNMNSSIGLNDINEDGSAWFTGLGGGGVVAGALLALTGVGLVPIALIGGAAGLGLGWLLGEDKEGFCTRIKVSILQKGFNKLEESYQEIFENIGDYIETTLSNRVQPVIEVIDQTIARLEKELEQQDKVHQETLAQREAEKAFISQKRQQLQQVQKDIKVISSSLHDT